MPELGERWRLTEGYRIELFADQDAVTEGDVIELWKREVSMPDDVARRRIDQVLVVATHESGALAGISTGYLERNPQLGLDLWYCRALVAEAHRLNHITPHLVVAVSDHLEQRYLAGEGSGAGVAYVLENKGLMRDFRDAILDPIDAVYIGDNRRGAPIRVHYFPGVLAPDPPR